MERLTQWNGEKYTLPQGRTSEGESYWRLIAERLAMYENAGWNDAKDGKPDKDDMYMVQTIYGDVRPMQYTPEGGWNTHRQDDGTICSDMVIDDRYVARWYKVPEPDAVPEEWAEAYWKGEE